MNLLKLYLIIKILDICFVVCVRFFFLFYVVGVIEFFYNEDLLDFMILFL